MKKIDTTTEAAGLDDINDVWKIVAHRHFRTVSGEIHAIWSYTGSLAETRNQTAFRKLAFMYSKGEVPHISCATGRDVAGNLILYARLYPLALRARQRQQGYA